MNNITIYIIRIATGRVVTRTMAPSANDPWVRALVKWHGQDGACRASKVCPVVDRPHVSATFNHGPNEGLNRMFRKA